MPGPSARILLVLPDPDRRRTFVEALAQALPWAQCVPAADVEGAWTTLAALGSAPPDVVVAEDLLPDGPGLPLLRRMSRRGASCILLAGPGTLAAALAAPELAACLAQPVEAGALVRSVAEALRRRAEPAPAEAAQDPQSRTLLM